MRRIPVALAVAIVAVLAGCGLTKTVKVTIGTKTGPGAPSAYAEFGYVRALTRKGEGFSLQFDPALLLSGVTASRAKFEDTGSTDVPDDYYVVNEGHRRFTYLVPADAKIAILAGSTERATITTAQLAELVAGRNPLGHALFEPLTTGFWVVVQNDTITSLDQQYFP